MTTFWKNLHQVARGQLFNGGYLDTRVVADQAAKAAATPAPRATVRDDPNRGLRHVQIAALR